MALFYDTTAKILRALLVFGVSCLLLNIAAAAEQNIKSIKAPVSGIGKVQQPGASYGGAKAETTSQAERRTPATLRHRERAVTTKDYKKLGNKSPGAAVHRARVRSAVVKTPRKLSTARQTIAPYKNCKALSEINKRINAALKKVIANNRLIAGLKRNKRNTRLANTIRRNIVSLRSQIRTLQSLVASMRLPASCQQRNLNTARAKEQYKMALRILSEHMERQTQVIQKITS
ncbi:MAG: hypothetical protein BMS9Abin11_0174 [Gammaproteobacteria bacterium]|nr:MAG: hypothetical protein BMS9Abin11_0174 [Gammaproteobacteria bacterium]